MGLGTVASGSEGDADQGGNFSGRSMRGRGGGNNDGGCEGDGLEMEIEVEMRVETETIGIDANVYEEPIGIKTHGKVPMEDIVGTSSETETKGGECPEGNGIRTRRETSVRKGGEPHSVTVVRRGLLLGGS